MNVSQFNRLQYDATWRNLARKLRAIEAGDGLPVALKTLYEQQLDLGFIQDDLASLEYYTFRDPENNARFFSVQYNPMRQQRFRGAGRTDPPTGVSVDNDGCFLCRSNIQWQQRGTEFGYPVMVGATDYIAWMNPYPLLPLHAVIATRDHVPQNWNSGTFDIRKILSDLVSLATRLPGFVGFYNGEGAGTSIPGHFHFQFFKRRASSARFALEVAAAKQANGKIDYPVTVKHWHGHSREIIDSAERWAMQWQQSFPEDAGNISANIFACCDNEQDEVQLYFVPRDQTRAFSSEMSGMIGGLEILGELVFSKEEEKQRLDQGEVNYHTVERVLSSIRV